MKLYVAKFSNGGSMDRKLEIFLNMLIADGTSFLAPTYDSFEQKPGDDGVHLLKSGMRLIHNHAHYILDSPSKDDLEKVIAALKPMIQSLSYLEMDTEVLNPEGLIGAAKR